MKQNPTEKLSRQERENIVWRPIVRACDDPHKAFARNRVTKPNVEIEETKGEQNEQ